MNTLSPYDREFLQMSGIAAQNQEDVAVDIDPSEGLDAPIGIRNALLLEIIAAFGVGSGIGLFYLLRWVAECIWRAL